MVVPYAHTELVFINKPLPSLSVVHGWLVRQQTNILLMLRSSEMSLFVHQNQDFAVPEVIDWCLQYKEFHKSEQRNCQLLSMVNFHFSEI